MELKECRQSHKEFCQSRDIFGVANICACVCEAQKGWCWGSSQFFWCWDTAKPCRSTKKIDCCRDTSPSVLSTHMHMHYTKNVEGLAKFFIRLKTFFRFPSKINTYFFVSINAVFHTSNFLNGEPLYAHIWQLKFIFGLVVCSQFCIPWDTLSLTQSHLRSFSSPTILITWWLSNPVGGPLGWIWFGC